MYTCKFNVEHRLSACKLNPHMVLHRWESETRRFGFIKLDDKGQITTLKDM